MKKMAAKEKEISKKKMRVARSARSGSDISNAGERSVNISMA